jgi:hypothetical protein
VGVLRDYGVREGEAVSAVLGRGLRGVAACGGARSSGAGGELERAVLGGIEEEMAGALSFGPARVNFF